MYSHKITDILEAINSVCWLIQYQSYVLWMWFCFFSRKQGFSLALTVSTVVLTVWYNYGCYFADAACVRPSDILMERKWTLTYSCQWRITSFDIFGKWKVPSLIASIYQSCLSFSGPVHLSINPIYSSHVPPVLCQ